jgi:two-component system response regulator HupR/HoxA
MVGARPSVLLVDDEPHSLSAMRMALEEEFDCLTASDAEAAVARMEEDWVQVVVCDQRMPGRTGVELLTELRERWPEAVRIIITGYTDPAAMAQAINDAGIHAFLTKPWHPDQLLMAVRNGARLFQLARENERMALEMRVLASTAQGKLDRRRQALREGMGVRKPAAQSAIVAERGGGHRASGGELRCAGADRGGTGDRPGAAGAGDAPGQPAVGPAVPCAEPGRPARGSGADRTVRGQAGLAAGGVNRIGLA